MPFKELGFSDERINELVSLNIIGLVQKYKRFYMPELINPGAVKVDINALMGPEVKLPDEDELQDEPRGWWRKNDTPDVSE